LTIQFIEFCDTQLGQLKNFDTCKNAFAIMGRAKQALNSADADEEYVDTFVQDAMSGDYDHLLCTGMDNVNVT